jgi:HSP20 family protein
LHGKEVSTMTMLRKFDPEKLGLDRKRMAPLTHSMEEFFEDFPPRRWMETHEPFGLKWPMGIDFERSFRLDILDRDKELLVRGELPGIERDEIEVTISGNYLTIEAKRKFEKEDEEEQFFRHELGYGELVRKVALPVEVDAEKIHAELKDGILTVRLPKIQAVERRTVKVT